MLINFKHRGSFKNIDRLLKRSSYLDTKYMSIFEKYGREGVSILQVKTPTDTGKTADSWSYEITRSKSGITLGWYNSNTVNGAPIAVIIQYGHATKNGGFVEGVDYINPALKPIFDKLIKDIWSEVSKS